MCVKEQLDTVESLEIFKCMKKQCLIAYPKQPVFWVTNQAWGNCDHRTGIKDRYC